MSVTIRGLKVLAGTFLFVLSLAGVANAATTPKVFNLKVEADQFLKRGQIERAISLYQRVLNEDSRFANAYYNLATAYYLRGELGKAAENLEAFLHFRPEDTEALYNLGCLKIRLGSFEEAMKCFLKAENCPCTRLISRKIKEALRFTKDLRRENSETQQLMAYLLTGSAQTLFSTAD